MKKLLLLLSVPVMIIAFSGCSKSNNPAPSTGNLMFVNGCAGSQNTDQYINGVKLTSNLAFLKNSGYQAVKAGSNVDVAFYLTSSGTPLVSGAENLAVSANYSAFAGGLVSGTSTSFVFTYDDLTPPASGMAKVRFVNLSSDNLNLSCYIGSQKIDSNVSMGSVTPFFSISSVTSAAILCQDPANPTALATPTSQSFASGKIYTIMLTGTSSAPSGSVSVLTLTIINNN